MGATSSSPTKKEPMTPRWGGAVRKTAKMLEKTGSVGMFTGAVTRCPKCGD